jgi:hypothetical protein
MSSFLDRNNNKPATVCYMISKYMNHIQLLSALSKQSKYLKWYILLVSKQYSTDVYTEKHHILPKSLGGDNSKSNIIRIPGRVHFILHKLLVRMVLNTKHKKNMCHALNMLAKANNKHQHRHQITSHEYELIRSRLSETMMGENNPMFGKPAPNRGITHNAETRAKLSAANIAHFKTHCGTRLGVKVSDETRAKQRGPKSETAKLNMSAAAKHKPRLVCEHCGLSVTKSNHTRWHGTQCKKAPKGPNASA